MLPVKQSNFLRLVSHIDIVDFQHHYAHCWAKDIPNASQKTERVIHLIEGKCADDNIHLTVITEQLGCEIQTKSSIVNLQTPARCNR